MFFKRLHHPNMPEKRLVTKPTKPVVVKMLKKHPKRRIWVTCQGFFSSIVWACRVPSIKYQLFVTVTAARSLTYPSFVPKNISRCLNKFFYIQLVSILYFSFGQPAGRAMVWTDSIIICRKKGSLPQFLQFYLSWLPYTTKTFLYRLFFLQNRQLNKGWLSNNRTKQKR